jgi:cytochrome c-type biogenesis protein CcmH/NrfF
MTRLRSSARRIGSACCALALGALGFGAPVQAQSPFGANVVTAGHTHEGELGELYLAIEHNIRCDCGCGLDVHSCQFQMQCGTSPGWSERIRQSLEAGQTREAIEASFVADFGRTVLMTPPAEGFNLVGYFLPGIAIITAGMLIGLIVRRGPGREEFAPVTLGQEDEERLRAAMRKLDEAESPDW